MKVEQLRYLSAANPEFLQKDEAVKQAQMVLVFGSKTLVREQRIFDDLRTFYPNAYILGCSTAGEIYNSQFSDDSLIATAVRFDKTDVKFASIDIQAGQDCYDAAITLASSIPKDNLKHVFVISEGINVNGSKLVEGLKDSLPPEVTLTGGLSADGSKFKSTYVIANDYACENKVAVAAFYGANVKIGYGSVGGWDSFGIERMVTASSDNILYELDGKPVLDLYKEYLGEHSKDLPMSALYFPLSIRAKDSDKKLVRTVLKVDENSRSLIFAGDIPPGYYARLMKANVNNLVAGAQKAAAISIDVMQQKNPKLAILISCVGRKLVLKQMIDDEIEATREIIGNSTVYTGFYSYGEICHAEKHSTSELHNQTMTITTIDED